MGKQIKTLSEAVAIRLGEHRRAASEARQRGEESMKRARRHGGSRGRVNATGSNSVAGRVDITADDGAVAGGRRSTPALGIGGGIGRGAMDSAPRAGYRTRGPK